MEHTPVVTVLIVNRNGAGYLPDCLTALYKQTLQPREVLIIDNASTDDSLNVIEAFRSQRSHNQSAMPQPTIHVFQNSENVGFGIANNQGIRNSSGDFVLLLNADVVLEQQFLAVLVNLMQQNQKAGLAAGKLLNYDERIRLDSTGLIIHKNRRAYDRGQGEIDTGQYDQEKGVFGVSGAACLCRRAMLEDIRYGDEYFDELFVVYKGDVDLSWRARLFGWTCVYSPEALGWHHRQWGVGKRQDIPRWVRRHSLKNRYLMLLKNDCWQHLLPAILPVLVFELGSLAYILLREPYLFQAFGDVVRLWPEVRKKRRYIQHIAHQRQQQDHLLRWFK